MPILATLRTLSRDGRAAFVASLLGWTLDAFDFFLLVFVVKAIADDFQVGVQVSAFAPTLAILLVLRALFGFAMGGEWGVGASLTMESVPPQSRGVVSGILQQRPLRADRLAGDVRGRRAAGAARAVVMNVASAWVNFVAIALRNCQERDGSASDDLNHNGLLESNLA